MFYNQWSSWASSVLTKKCVGCTLCELDCPYDAIHIFRADSDQAAARIERNARFEEEIGIRSPDPEEDERAARAIEEMADAMVQLQESVAAGPTDEVFTQENLRRTYGGKLTLFTQAANEVVQSR